MIDRENKNSEEYEISDDSGATETITATSMEAAKEQAEDIWMDGEWGEEGQFFVDVYITRISDGEQDSISVLVGDDPEPPECIEDYEHDWQSPIWLGGLRENAGVWSQGDHIISYEVCSHCGIYRRYISESLQNNTPPQTTYEDSDEASEKWIAELREEDE